MIIMFGIYIALLSTTVKARLGPLLQRSPHKSIRGFKEQLLRAQMIASFGQLVSAMLVFFNANEIAEASDFPYVSRL